MDDPIIQSFLLSINNNGNGNEENTNNGDQRKGNQQIPLITDSEINENMAVKLLEAAILSSDEVLSEHVFKVFRRSSINHLPGRYGTESQNGNKSSAIFKSNHNGNGTQGNCLLTYIICNRHMNKILEKLQAMNKENRDDLHIQVRVGRFLEILRLCSLSHPKSTIANIWFLPWILEFINFDVTYVFFSKIFNYGESYQKWMNSNDFFISALNAARELQAKISNLALPSNNNPGNNDTKRDTEMSIIIDNQKLENLYLLITDFLSLQNFRDKCQSPFRLSKMIKIPFHYTTLSAEFDEKKDKIAQFKLNTIICFTNMLCTLYSGGSKKAFEDNLAEYVILASAIMEIENKKLDIFPILTFDENFENVRISRIKVNLMELISLIIDGINEQDEKRNEKIFSYSITPSSNTAPSTSSVSPPPSFSSSSSFVSCSSQLFSFSSSASELIDSPPLLNMIISIAEESLLRPRNEFEFQKAVKIITSLIRKKLIGDDEVSDFFFTGLLSSFKREKKPIQRMALCVLASELPSLKNCMNDTTIIHDESNKNENDFDNSIEQPMSINIEIGNDFKKEIGGTDEINEIVKIDEIEKIDGIEKVNETDKISEIDEMVLIDSIVNDMSDSDCGDFITPMQDVIQKDYGNA